MTHSSVWAAALSPALPHFTIKLQIIWFLPWRREVFPREERGCPENTWSYYMCKLGIFGVLKCRRRYNLHLPREEMKVKQRVYIKTEFFWPQMPEPEWHQLQNVPALSHAFHLWAARSHVQGLYFQTCASTPDTSKSCLSLERFPPHTEFCKTRR